MLPSAKVHQIIRQKRSNHLCTLFFFSGNVASTLFIHLSPFPPPLRWTERPASANQTRACTKKNPPGALQ